MRNKIRKLEMKYIGICLGKFGPLHNGHINNILEMIKKYGADNSLIIIGSSNEEISLRNFFTYSERREIIKTVFPNIKIIGLPDYWRLGNDEWYIACKDLLDSVAPNRKRVFFTGSVEDGRWFNKINNSEVILSNNRFIDNISSTKIRDILLRQKFDELNQLVHPDTKRLIIKFYYQRYISTIIEFDHNELI